MESEQSTPKLGEILIESGMITADQVKEALDISASQGIRLGEALVQLGAIRQDCVTWALGSQLHLSFVDLQLDMIDWDFLLQFDIETLWKLSLLPISRVGDSVTTVVSDPFVEGLQQAVGELFPYHEVTVQLTSREAIEHALHEAARLLTDRRLTKDAAPRKLQTANKADVMEMLETGAATRVLTIQSNIFPDGALFTDSPVFSAGWVASSEQVNQLNRTLSGEFHSICSVPGGFYGIRPSLAGTGYPSIRAITIVGLDGRATALMSIQTPAANLLPSRIHFLTALSPIRAKRALLAELTKLNGKMPVLSLESSADCAHPGSFQSEISDSTARTSAWRLLTSAGEWKAALLNVETPEDLFRLGEFTAAGDYPLIILCTKPASAAVSVDASYIQSHFLDDEKPEAIENLIRSISGEKSETR